MQTSKKREYKSKEPRFCNSCMEYALKHQAFPRKFRSTFEAFVKKEIETRLKKLCDKASEDIDAEETSYAYKAGFMACIKKLNKSNKKI